MDREGDTGIHLIPIRRSLVSSCSSTEESIVYIADLPGEFEIEIDPRNGAVLLYNEKIGIVWIKQEPLTPERMFKCRENILNIKKQGLIAWCFAEINSLRILSDYLIYKDNLPPLAHNFLDSSIGSCNGLPRSYYEQLCYFTVRKKGGNSSFTYRLELFASVAA